MSLPFRLLLRFLFTVLLVWGMARGLPDHIAIQGGMPAFIVIGALLTLLNMFVRPLLGLITLPLRLVMTLVAIILVNAVFLWLVQQVAMAFDPTLVRLSIHPSLESWIIVSSALGIGNWLLRLVK